MGWFKNKQINKSVVLFLAVALMAFYSASILTMHNADGMDRMQMASGCGFVGGDFRSSPGNACLDYHFGLLHSLSESVFGSLGTLMIICAVLLVAGFSLFNLGLFLKVYYSRLRVRYRRLYEKTVFAFYAQLGRWLTLFEKRHPANAFAKA